MNDCANYYISSTGNNKNNGTQNFPWQTLTPLPTLKPGDHVLFKSGDIFTFSISPTQSGNSTHPIVFSTFGGTTMATFNTGDQTGFNGYNIGGITISNLNFTTSVNTSDGISFYADSTCTNSCYYKYINITDCEISGYKQGLIIGSGNTRTGFVDVYITRVIAHDNVLIGIYTYGFYPELSIFNVIIRYCVAFNNRENASYTQSHTGNGIIVSGADGAVVEYCTAYRNGEKNGHSGGGPVGIWTYNANNVLIQYSLSYLNEDGNLGVDGGGFDIDGGATNSIIQYCYSWGNKGPGYLYAQYDSAPAFSNNTIRYCISQNDKGNNKGGIILYSSGSSGGIVDSYVYGNTVYTTGIPGITFLSGAMNRVKIFNNILVVNSSSTTPIINYQNVTNLNITGNVMWKTNGVFSSSMGTTTYSSLIGFQSTPGIARNVFVDPQLNGIGRGPLLTDVNLINSFFNYHPTTASPVLGAGDLVSTYISRGLPISDYSGLEFNSQNQKDVGAIISECQSGVCCNDNNTRFKNDNSICDNGAPGNGICVSGTCQPIPPSTSTSSTPSTSQSTTTSTSSTPSTSTSSTSSSTSSTSTSFTTSPTSTTQLTATSTTQSTTSTSSTSTSTSSTSSSTSSTSSFTVPNLLLLIGVLNFWINIK